MQILVGIIIIQRNYPLTLLFTSWLKSKPIRWQGFHALGHNLASETFESAMYAIALDGDALQIHWICRNDPYMSDRFMWSLGAGAFYGHLSWTLWPCLSSQSRGHYRNRKVGFNCFPFGGRASITKLALTVLGGFVHCRGKIEDVF